MDPFIAGSIVSGGSNLVGSIINGIFGVNEAKKDREFNSAEAEKTREFQRQERLASQEWDLNMWNLNNEYNSVGAQIERARAAGVNPAAILGGDYKSAQANAPTTTPMQGATASSSSGGAVGSALINSSASLATSFTGGLKSFIDSYSTSEMIELNKKYLESNISKNWTSIADLMAGIGVKDATEEQIRKATSWMDGLNTVAILEKASHATLMYNQSYEVLQMIKESESRIAVNESTVELNKATTDYRNAQTALTHLQSDYQSTINQYADDMQKAMLTQEQVKAYEAQLRQQFATHFGLPLGSSEFEFMWQMHLNGKVEEFIKGVVVPKNRAGWTPRDVIVPYHQGNGYTTMHDGRKMLINPQYGNGYSGPPPLTPQ